MTGRLSTAKGGPMVSVGYEQLTAALDRAFAGPEDAPAQSKAGDFDSAADSRAGLTCRRAGPSTLWNSAQPKCSRPV
jgi:hypothetical protein